MYARLAPISSALPCPALPCPPNIRLRRKAAANAVLTQAQTQTQAVTSVQPIPSTYRSLAASDITGGHEDREDTSGERTGAGRGLEQSDVPSTPYQPLEDSHLVSNDSDSDSDSDDINGDDNDTEAGTSGSGLLHYKGLVRSSTHTRSSVAATSSASERRAKLLQGFSVKTAGVGRRPIYAIVAVAANDVIGCSVRGGLPWSVPEDFKYFIDSTEVGTV